MDEDGDGDKDYQAGQMAHLRWGPCLVNETSIDRGVPGSFIESQLNHNVLFEQYDGPVAFWLQS